MIEAIEKYIATFDDRTIQRFRFIFNLIRESVSQEIEEKLWAKLPSFYHGENFVRLILFKDHINIEAKGITAHQDELQGYKVTPKRHAANRSQSGYSCRNTEIDLQGKSGGYLATDYSGHTK